MAKPKVDLTYQNFITLTGHHDHRMHQELKQLDYQLERGFCDKAIYTFGRAALHAGQSVAFAEGISAERRSQADRQTGRRLQEAEKRLRHACPRSPR